MHGNIFKRIRQGKMSIKVDGYREGGTIPQSNEGRKTEFGSSSEQYIWRREMKEEE